MLHQLVALHVLGCFSMDGLGPTFCFGFPIVHVVAVASDITKLSDVQRKAW